MIGGTYSLKSSLNEQFLWNFLRQIYLLSEILQEICRGNILLYWEKLIKERRTIPHRWFEA